MLRARAAICFAPTCLALICLALGSTLAGVAAADGDAPSDGAYGRLDGDLGVSLEVGVTETVGGERGSGESLAVRAASHYLSTVGLTAQYDDGLGVEGIPMRRSFVGGVEVRPLFLGRFAQDLERGPAHLDLWLDSLALGLGVYTRWWRQALCPTTSCVDHGMELAAGLEIPLLADASTPFVGLRGALRWSLVDTHPTSGGTPPDWPTTTGTLTLTLGYRQLLPAHLVDAGDRLAD